jgi:riboflavin biosynthesis pyrimidine reductase
VILRRIFPDADSSIDVSEASARERLIALYEPPSGQWLRINLIASVSGSASGTDGTSESLSNPADRKILGAIRLLSDVVLVGAASVRAEGYFVPRSAALAIVTGSGDLSGHRITATGERGPLIVLCPRSATTRARETLDELPATIIEVESVRGRMDAADIVTAVHANGFTSIVCEGGPGLAAQLLEAGLVDELCLTTSPTINGTALPLFGAKPLTPRPLTLTQLLVDDASGVYARWSLVAP